MSFQIIKRSNSWILWEGKSAEGRKVYAVTSDSREPSRGLPSKTAAFREFRESRYNEICSTLGFSAKSGFVKTNPSGSISFTLGKPDEIRALAIACDREGFVKSAKLSKILNRL